MTIITGITRLYMCSFALCLVSCCTMLLPPTPPVSFGPPPFQGGVNRFDGMLDKGVFQSVSSTIQEEQPLLLNQAFADDSVQRKVGKLTFYVIINYNYYRLT